MSRKTVIIGSREYSFSKMPAFQGNSILIKLQRLVLPVMGEFTSGKGLDMNLRQAAEIVSSKIDDSVMTEIILPMFNLAQVSTPERKIVDAPSFNQTFTIDELGDFYELVYEVLKHNFGNFLTGLMSRFGSLEKDATKS